MARIFFLICFLYGSQGFSVVSKSILFSKDHEPASKSRAEKPSPLQQFEMTTRYSAKSWSTPEEVIPPEFYDIPGEERSPNSNKDNEITVDDVYGGNKEVPDYGAAFEAEEEFFDDVLNY